MNLDLRRNAAKKGLRRQVFPIGTLAGLLAGSALALFSAAQLVPAGEFVSPP